MTQTAPSAFHAQAKAEIEAEIRKHKANRANKLLEIIAIELRTLRLNYQHVEGYKEVR